MIEMGEISAVLSTDDRRDILTKLVGGLLLFLQLGRPSVSPCSCDVD